MLNLLKTSLIFLAALVLFGCSQSPTPANNTYSISGAVLNEVDNPLANIKVTLNNAATSATLATTLSDKDGNYSFTGLANGSYTVNADLTIYSLTVLSPPAVIINGASKARINCVGRPPRSPTPTATPSPSTTSVPTPTPTTTPTATPTTTPTVTPTPTVKPSPTPSPTPTPTPTATPTPVPTVTPSPVPSGTRNFDLHVKSGILIINDKNGVALASIPAWGFSPGTGFPKVISTAQFPAPAITVTEGDTVNITVYNDHTVNHNFVIKGIQTNSAANAEITPGMSKMYTFTAAANSAGTYLYYDSLNNEVNREMGLYGALIVRPKDGSNTAFAGAPAFTFERTWVVGDMDAVRWNAVADANAQRAVPANPPPVTTAIYKPNYFVINGKGGFDAMKAPTPLIPNDTSIVGTVGESALVRIVNGGLFSQALHFHANHVQVLSKNGEHYIRPFKLVDVIDVAPLSTVEVLFELNQVGEYPMHNHTAQMETANGVYLGGVATKIQIDPKPLP